MKLFRINIYLKFSLFIKSIFIRYYFLDNKISNILKRNSKKKYFVLSSQLRVGFLVLLKYLKSKNKKKNEIIFSPYNLAEMINVAKNIGFKIVFSKINFDDAFYDFNYLKKKINKNTAAIVLTNMFNSYEDSKKIRNLCTNKKIYLIEDNAIYFDNYKLVNGKKIFTGSFGDFSLYSFNIMKNISALFGGGVATNDSAFINFYSNEIKKYSHFPFLRYLKQNFLYVLLKILSVKYFYNLFFFKIVKSAHLNKNFFLLKLFYPSLKFKIIKFPKYYFTKISNFSKKLIFLQLNDTVNRIQNHQIRKNNNIFYDKLFKKKNIKQVKLLMITDYNFQNFIDYPIIVNNKNDLNRYLLKKGIETRLLYYKDCTKLFDHKNTKNNTTEDLEKKIICLPNHSKVTKKYMFFLVNSIKQFYDKK